jgi:hypothetical protein
MIPAEFRPISGIQAEIPGKWSVAALNLFFLFA